MALTGLGAGVGGALLTLLLHGVQHLAFGYTENTFLFGVERAPGIRRLLMLILAGVIAGGGWYALRRWLKPVPRLADALHDAPERVPYLPLILDSLLQIVVVALGASLGREGAPRQFGAAAGDWLSRRAGLTAERRHILLACGAGSGLAAVYNVPFGGALFSIEVLLGSAALRCVVPALLTSAIATAVAWSVLPNEPTYHLREVSLSGTLTTWAIVAAPLIGLFAAGFQRLTNLAMSHRPTGWRMPPTVLVAFTALGAASIAYPALLGNGKGPAQLAFDGDVGWWTLIGLVLLKPLFTAACLGAGATGGRLTPAVATGALAGALTGKIWLLMWPGANLTEFAIIAATAFLAVTLDAPITAIALILEFTHAGASLLVPTLLAVGIATGTAWSVSEHRRPAIR